MSLSFFVLSDDEPTFPGLISSDVFNMGNGMVMHVERRNSCNQDGTPKHFHPAAGTLVYVLDGTSQSKSTGDWKEYNKNEYWFERSDWVHGGEEDTPSLPEGTCQKLLVIRVAEEGKDHTIFATTEGAVKFHKGLKGRTFISVLPVLEAAE